MAPTPSNSYSDRDRDRERVREATDIVRLVGEHVALKPKGREFVGLCPFHDDHSPSMYVVPSKQIFNCFVCQAAGDVFSFVQRLHKMDFPEAVKYLAERAGIELTPWRPAGAGLPDRGDDAPARASRRELFAANAAACDFFRAILRHPEHGRPARDVIERRGIAPEMVELFALGASPDRWDGLALTIQNKNLRAAHFEQAGLLKRRGVTGEGVAGEIGAGGCYDALRHRLIFPIHDATGRVIAFGGRKVRDEDEPKYLNSPETALFKKSSTLYGLFQAAKAIGQARTAIVTEGYTDTIACHQAGFTNTVATLGTALTPGHAHLLQRYCDTIVLLFDGDAAGERAAERAVEVLFSSEVDVTIATLAGLTDAKDPDELLKRAGGAEILHRAIAEARNLLTFRYERLRQRLTGPALTRRFDEEVETLVRLGYESLRPEKRRVIQRQLAATWGVDEAAINQRLRQKGVRSISPLPRIAVPAATGRPSPIAALIGCVLADEALWAELPDLERQLLTSASDQSDDPTLASVAEAVLELVDSGERCGLLPLLDRLTDAAHRAWAITQEEWVRRESEGNEERIDRLRRDCVARMVRDGDAGQQRLVEPKGGPVTAPVAADAQFTPTSRLEALRQQHRTWGPNRTNLPRPAGS